MEQHPHLDPCKNCSVGHRAPDDATPLSHGEDFVRSMARQAGIASEDIDGEVLQVNNEVTCDGNRFCPRLSAFFAAVQQIRTQRDDQTKQV